MIYFLYILLLCSSGYSLTGKDSVITETVDAIECNHCYEEDGTLKFNQFIFYEFSHDYGRSHVMSWFMYHNDQHVNGVIRPVVKYDPNSKEWTVKWRDRDGHITRIVKSKVFTETWTENDPERENKSLMPEKYRIGFKKQILTNY